jgi:hypothetical protein
MWPWVSRLLEKFRPRGAESNLVLDVRRTGVVHSTIGLFHSKAGGFDLRGTLHFNEARDPDGDQWRYYVKEADLIAMAEGCALEYESIAFKEAKAAKTKITIEKETSTERKTAKGANASGEIGFSLSKGFNADAQAKADASIHAARSEASKETYGKTRDLSLITLHFSGEGRFVSWSMRPDLADTKDCLGEHVAVLHGEWLAVPKGGRLGHVKLDGARGQVELFLEIKDVALSRWSQADQTEGAATDRRALLSKISLLKAVTKRFPLQTLACGNTTIEASQ